MSLATLQTKPTKTKTKTKQHDFSSASTNQQSLKAQSLTTINPDILLLPAEQSGGAKGLKEKPE